MLYFPLLELALLYHALISSSRVLCKTFIIDDFCGCSALHFIHFCNLKRSNFNVCGFGVTFLHKNHKPSASEPACKPNPTSAQLESAHLTGRCKSKRNGFPSAHRRPKNRFFLIFSKQTKFYSTARSSRSSPLSFTYPYL